MQKKLLRTFVCMLLIFLSCRGLAPAAERVEIEKIYTSDPTVAKEGGWVLGAGAEIWYMNVESDVLDSEGRKTGTQNGGGWFPGASIYFGTERFTVFLAGREGSIDYDTEMNDGVKFKTDFDRTEMELKFRYLFTEVLDAKSVVPYLIGGVQYSKMDEKNKIETPGVVWTATGTSVLKTDYKTYSPFLGVGVLVPVGEIFGIRLDLTPLWNYQKVEIKNSNENDETEKGVTFVLHLTAYANVTKHINFQLGLKAGTIQFGDRTNSFQGYYAMLGFAF